MTEKKPRSTFPCQTETDSSSPNWPYPAEFTSRGYLKPAAMETANHIGASHYHACAFKSFAILHVFIRTSRSNYSFINKLL